MARTDFPICANPNCKQKFGEGKDVKVNFGYHERCSPHCKKHDPNLVLKSKATRKEKYGDENYVNIEAMQKTVAKHIELDPDYYKKKTIKTKKTLLEKYGAENYVNVEAMLNTKHKKQLEDPNYLVKQIEKAKATKTRNHGDSNWNNRKKAIKTNNERFGYDWAS